MPWIQIILDTEVSRVEQISDDLFAIGAVSVTLQDAEDQPVYEPPLNTTPLWEKTRIVALFEGDTNTIKLEKQLHAFPPYEIQNLEDQDWIRVCRDDFHPMSFGKHVWICPSWQIPPDPEGINILLDPGLAFGTGTHATTALCLEWLDQQVDFSSKTVIDYGCGSGILAITAVKLGATNVWAVDNDPQALDATLENAKKNSVDNFIQTVLPEQLPHIKADAILANILAGPLIKLASSFALYANTDALIVLSGILKNQGDEVIAAYKPYFTIKKVVERDNWVRIIAQKCGTEKCK